MTAHVTKPAEARDEMLENGAEPSAACVGIFWFVMRGGRPELASCKTPWQEAEDYGDFKTESTAHYEFWPNLQRRLKVIGEYEDWPRGRVVYNVRDDRFTVYIDRQLAGAPFKAHLLAHFALPADKTTFAFDAHYSGAKFKVKGQP
ncbi:hypothetical protein ACI7BZ_03180 [Xanthobacter sp. AM11]|uniref:hypothetical protein n=1 Tax=Xanthobacter sp. AM11 TaxID=3380643 RepID=UPI0039BF829B